MCMHVCIRPSLVYDSFLSLSTSILMCCIKIDYLMKPHPVAIFLVDTVRGKVLEGENFGESALS